MKRKIMLLIILVILLSLTILSFAATTTAYTSVSGNANFSWSGQCTANFDTTTGVFYSHGRMVKISKPANTSTYTYKVQSYGDSSANYYAYQTAEASRYTLATGHFVYESKPVTISSPGASK